MALVAPHILRLWVHCDSCGCVRKKGSRRRTSHGQWVSFHCIGAYIVVIDAWCLCIYVSLGMFVWSRVAESLSVSLSAVSVFVSVSLVSSRTHNVHSRGTVVLKKRSFCAAIAVASPLFLSIVGLLAVLFAVPRSLAPLPTFWPLLVSCVVSSAIAHETTLSTPVVSVYSLALPTCTSGFGWGCVFRSVNVRWFVGVRLVFIVRLGRRCVSTGLMCALGPPLVAVLYNSVHAHHRCCAAVSTRLAQPPPPDTHTWPTPGL